MVLIMSVLLNFIIGPHIYPVAFQSDKLICIDRFYTPVFKTGVLWYTTVRASVRPFHMSLSNLRTPWPIHFKFHRVIGIDGLTVCILYGEISNFHSRVIGLYSSNCRRFFVCRAVNWEPLGQFTSNLAQLLEYCCFESCQFRPRSVFFLSWHLNTLADDFRCLRYYCDNVSIS
jgi:hypothetical protein